VPGAADQDQLQNAKGPEAGRRRAAKIENRMYGRCRPR
jgi:hypothetical protein